MVDSSRKKMLRKLFAAAAILLIATAFTSACGANASQPTLVPTLSLPQAEQGATVEQAAGAPAAPPGSNTGETAPPESSSLPLPQGTPTADWKGLPVMPDAIAGQGDDQGYFYSTKASLEAIRAYYEETLAAQDWVLMAANEGRANSVMLFFEKGDESANVAIIDNRRPDGLVIVLLIKD